MSENFSEIFSCLNGLKYVESKDSQETAQNLQELQKRKRPRDFKNLQHFQSATKKQKESIVLGELEVPKVRNTQIYSTYEIPLSELPKNWEQSQWMSQFTIQPKESKGFKKDPTPPFPVYKVVNNKLCIPRFRGIELFGPAQINSCSAGEPMSEGSSFKGNLRPHQVEPCTLTVNNLLKNGGATLILPCGQGKTVSSIYISRHPKIRRRTLVIVTKTRLMTQWITEIPKFSNSNAPIGLIQGNQFKTDGCDFVVGSIQTIISKRRSFHTKDFDQFGTVIVDEAHHISARSFSQVMQLMGAKFVLALTATPDRKDGLGFLIHWLLGPVSCDRRRKVGEDKVEVQMITYTRGNEKEIRYKDDRIGYAQMVNNLLKDKIRTKLIVEKMSELFDRNKPIRNILVMTTRRNHAKSLLSLFSKKVPWINVGLMLGRMSQEELDAAQRMPVIFSTYDMWSEGLDEPRLDTLILAAPKSDIEQSVGRILRKHSTKCQQLIIDIIDPFSIFQNQAWKRKNFYKKLGYSITYTKDIEMENNNQELFHDIFLLENNNDKNNEKTNCKTNDKLIHNIFSLKNNDKPKNNLNESLVNNIFSLKDNDNDN